MDLDTIVLVKVMQYVKIIEIMIQDLLMREVVIEQIPIIGLAVTINGIALIENIQYKHITKR